MRTPQEGLSIIELVVVIAVLGILLAIGLPRINPNGAATRQAAEVVSAAVTRARYEAIRTNNTAGIRILAGTAGGSGTVTICRDVDELAALSCTTGSVAETIGFEGGDLGRAVISAPVDMTLFFDRRGVLRNPATSGYTVTIADRSGGNQKTVTILPTGRAEVD